MNFPVFDFHCDTALALLGEDFFGGFVLVLPGVQLVVVALQRPVVREVRVKLCPCHQGRERHA